MATEGLPPKKGFCLDGSWRRRMRKEVSLLSQMFQKHTTLKPAILIWTPVLWPKTRIKKKGAKNILVPVSSGSNCQHLLDHRKIKGITEKTSNSASLITLKPLTVWIITNCGKFLQRWEYQTTLPVLWETCMKNEKSDRVYFRGLQNHCGPWPQLWN